jgi:hypothetical protein
MKKTTLLFIVSMYATISLSQNVGISNTPIIPAPSAQLEVRSTSKGVLIPRMTTVEMGLIVAPAQGLMVYNTDTKSFLYYDGFWKEMSIKDDNVWSKNADHIYNNNLGFVGVGTNSPGTKLDVASGSSGAIARFSGGTSTWMEFRENNVYRGYLGSFSGNAEDMDFGTGSGNTTGKIHFTIGAIPKVTVSDLGYLGIGKIVPNSPLHVVGGTGAGGVLPFFSTITAENNGNTFLSLLAPNANEAGMIFGLNSNNISGSVVYNNASTPKGLQFRTRNNITQMVLDSLGNVGIGDITPTSRLNVTSTTASNIANFDGRTGMFIGLYENATYRGYLGSFSGAATDVDFGTGAGNTTGKLNFTIQASPKFSIASDGTAQVLGSNILEIGAGTLGKETNAGKIGYNAFGQSALTIVGAGTTIGTRALYFYAEAGTTTNGPIYIEKATGGAPTIEIKPSETGVDGSEILLYNAAGVATIELDADFGDGDGRVITSELQIKGGSDLAEHFDIAIDEEAEAKSGMLVSIDTKTEGKLCLTNQPSDTKIVGVISGANGIKPGMLMGQEGSIAFGKYPIALAGRVYVLATNEAGEINAGDFLTSSSKKGYAKKVTNINKSQGAIIGKAMGKVNPDNGYVLVLINLQ